MEPATLVLILIVGLLLLLAGLLLGGNRRQRVCQRVCPDRDCGQVNPPQARYCARCGKPLSGAGQQATNQR